VTTELRENIQKAPYPEKLEALVDRLEYRRWQFALIDLDRDQGSQGLTLRITTTGFDSYHPERGETYRVNHFMPVPPAAYNEQSWRRWLFEQVLLVERHECCEFFKIDGKRQYAPHHGPGHDPYVVFERGTDEDVRTMYTGQVRKARPDTASCGDSEFLLSLADALGEREAHQVREVAARLKALEQALLPESTKGAP
jgi:hypothetical protein